MKLSVAMAKLKKTEDRAKGSPKPKPGDSKEILRRLEEQYKNARCALNHESPFQLLIATILSAQCTDERVNKVTPNLFERFPTAEDMARANVSELENLVRTTGFFRNKAHNILMCSHQIVEKHGGRVPPSMDDLVTLPGVGRKTANVVLGNAFGIASGIVVDTHVLRLSQRLGWIRTQNPQIAERNLIEQVPKDKWVAFSHWLIFHGRQVCVARSPRCQKCFLQDLCPKKGIVSLKSRHRK